MAHSTTAGKAPLASGAWSEWQRQLEQLLLQHPLASTALKQQLAEDLQQVAARQEARWQQLAAAAGGISGCAAGSSSSSSSSYRNSRAGGDDYDGDETLPGDAATAAASGHADGNGTASLAADGTGVHVFQSQPAAHGAPDSSGAAGVLLESALATLRHGSHVLRYASSTSYQSSSDRASGSDPSLADNHSSASPTRSSSCTNMSCCDNGLEAPTPAPTAAGGLSRSSSHAGSRQVGTTACLSVVHGAGLTGHMHHATAPQL